MRIHRYKKANNSQPECIYVDRVCCCQGDDPTATESVYFVNNHSKTRYFPLYEENGPMCYNGFSSGIRCIYEPPLKGNTILARRRPAAAEVCQGRRTDLARIYRQIPRNDVDIGLKLLVSICSLYAVCIKGFAYHFQSLLATAPRFS